MNLLNWLKTRMTEPSTHNGLAILSLLLPSLVPPQYQGFLPFVTAFFASMGVVMPDSKGAANLATTAASFIPEFQYAANPALAHAINIGIQAGVQAAITDLLSAPVKK